MLCNKKYEKPSFEKSEIFAQDYYETEAYTLLNNYAATCLPILTFITDAFGLVASVGQLCFLC